MLRVPSGRLIGSVLLSGGVAGTVAVYLVVVLGTSLFFALAPGTWLEGEDTPPDGDRGGLGPAAGVRRRGPGVVRAERRLGLPGAPLRRRAAPAPRPHRDHPPDRPAGPCAGRDREPAAVLAAVRLAPGEGVRGRLRRGRRRQAQHRTARGPVGGRAAGADRGRPGPGPRRRPPRGRGPHPRPPHAPGPARLGDRGRLPPHPTPRPLVVQLVRLAAPGLHDDAGPAGGAQRALEPRAADPPARARADRRPGPGPRAAPPAPGHGARAHGRRPRRPAGPGRGGRPRAVRGGGPARRRLPPPGRPRPLDAPRGARPLRAAHPRGGRHRGGPRGAGARRRRPARRPRGGVAGTDPEPRTSHEERP